MNGTEQPLVVEPCHPGRAVSAYQIARRLDEATLREMAVMLAIVHPGHFETVLRDRGQR